MKIVICLPVYDTFKADTTRSLVGLTARTIRERPDIEIAAATASGFRIWQVREVLAENALVQGADWLLWVDADMEVPDDGLLQLLAHGLPMVAANYRMRREDKPAALKGGNRIWSKASGPKVEPVDVVGFGFCLTAAALLKRLQRPWFSDGPDGEDGHFCAAVRRVGAPPHVDHALSMECGHIAETVLRFPR